MSKFATGVSGVGHAAFVNCCIECELALVPIPKVLHVEHTQRQRGQTGRALQERMGSHSQRDTKGVDL